jgi:hypothetical protein
VAAGANNALVRGLVDTVEVKAGRWALHAQQRDPARRQRGPGHVSQPSPSVTQALRSAGYEARLAQAAASIGVSRARCAASNPG